MTSARAGVLATVLIVGGALAGGLLPGTAAATGPPTAATPRVTPVLQGAEDARLRLKERFAREVARRGDEDRGPRAIEHVTELQYRLRWASVYRGPVTGYFGDLTRAAVIRFQRKADLRVSGVATHPTWRALIKRTTQHEKALPRLCTRGIGWHACYDRSRHQVTLWKRGTLWNTWLVRGGARGYETRTGRFTVFRRDRDHVSSLYGSPMPYSQFFSGGQAFHGSSYMTNPFRGHSHGCVNMYIEDARQLWRITHDVRLNVHVYGRWS